MNDEDNSQDKQGRRERILAFVVGGPLIAFILAYELFGWLPPIPSQIAHGLGFAFRFAFALFASAVVSAWIYLFLAWVRPTWLRISITAVAALYIGFGAIFFGGGYVDDDCRPAGPGIYNDC